MRVLRVVIDRPRAQSEDLFLGAGGVPATVASEELAPEIDYVGNWGAILRRLPATSGRTAISFWPFPLEQRSSYVGATLLHVKHNDAIHTPCGWGVLYSLRSQGIVKARIGPKSKDRANIPGEACAHQGAPSNHRASRTFLLVLKSA